MLLAPAVSPREPALAEGTGANNPAIRLFKFNPNSGQVHSSAAAIVACLTTQLSPSSTYTRMPIDPTFGGSSERRAGGNEIGTGGGAEGAQICFNLNYDRSPHIYNECGMKERS